MSCVPVSTAGALVQKHETLQPVSEPLALLLLACSDELLAATLVTKGWILGCDGELLPPASFGQEDA